MVTSARPKKAVLNPIEYDVIDGYSAEDYQAINAYLRNNKEIPAEIEDELGVFADGKLMTDREAAKRVAILDSIIDRSEVGETKLFAGAKTGDHQLYRGTKLATFGVDKASDLKVGQTLRNHAYISTSRSISQAEKHLNSASKGRGDVLMRIKTSPTSRGYDMANVSRFGSEREVLLSRHSRFKITKISDYGKGRVMIDVEHIDK